MSCVYNQPISSGQQIHIQRANIRRIHDGSGPIAGSARQHSHCCRVGTRWSYGHHVRPTGSQHIQIATSSVDIRGFNPRGEDRSESSFGDGFNRQVDVDDATSTSEVQHITAAVRIATIHVKLIVIMIARDVEGVVTIQTTQLDDTDPGSVQVNCDKRTGRIDDLDLISGAHVEDVAIRRAVQFEHVFAPASTGEADRSSSPQLFERQRHQCCATASSTDGNRTCVRSTTWGISQLIDTSRCVDAQGIRTTRTVDDHRFGQREIHRRRPTHGHRTCSQGRGGGVIDQVAAGSRIDDDRIAGSRITAVNVERRYADQCGRMDVERVVAIGTVQSQSRVITEGDRCTITDGHRIAILINRVVAIRPIDGQRTSVVTRQDDVFDPQEADVVDGTG